MNIIRRKINKWLIGKQIQQAINDFEDTLEYISNKINCYDECCIYAETKRTHRGLCDYFHHHSPMRSGWIYGYLGLNLQGYMFQSAGASTIRAIERLSGTQFWSWRKIAIDLYKQRIDYLKKFI